jgi:integrase
VLIPPDPKQRHHTWRARVLDPDTEREEKVRLDPMALGSTEARRHWAIKKSKAIAKRQMELESGAHRETRTDPSKAIERFFKDHEHLRPSTIRGYRATANKFLRWAEGNGIRTCDDLTGPKLTAFRAEIVKAKKHAQASGGKRGARKKTAEPRSAYTVNGELRNIRAVFGYLRKLGLLPHANLEEMKYGLERIRVSTNRIDYRKPHELQQLLDTALEHDEKMFKETRAEHAGRRPVGTTPRHETPVAPFIACALLTGMRLGEIVDLDWRNVDLEALDHDGRVVGEIHLSAATKTHKARTIGLEVSPALRRLLAALKLKCGGKGNVFGLRREEAVAAEKRLRKMGAPDGSNYQALRRSCGTYLTNAPGIFGASSAYRSARQLGHSVQVAEKHYLDVARGIRRDARTLEAAMQIEEQMKRVVDAAMIRRPVQKAG